MGALLVLLLTSVAAFVLVALAIDALRGAFEQYRVRYLARSRMDLAR